MKIVAQLVLLPLLAFSGLLATASPRAVGRIGRGIGGLLFALGFRRKIVSSNLELALGNELSGEQREELAEKIFSSVGTLFLEIARNFALSPSQMRAEVRVSDAD